MGALADVIGDYRRALYAIVADRLTGRKCAIEWRKPYIKGTIGLTARGEDPGSVKIFIDPALDDTKQLDTFLHECAHGRLHYHLLPNNQEHEAPAASYRIVDRDRFTDDNRQDEQEADAMAVYWQSYCEDVTSISGKLSKLLSWSA